MPELPGSDQLGQRAFQDRSQVVTPRVDTSGMDNLVNTFQNVSSNINDRLDRSALQKAKISFQKAKLEADSAFDQDPDFATHEKRYNETLGKAVESSSKMLRSPRMQEQFKQDVSLYQVEGGLGIKKRALMKEHDQGLADLDESLTMARENYLRAKTPEDKEYSRQSLMDSIDVAEQHGYLDKQKATNIRQKAALDLAIASVNTEPAGMQAKILKEHKGLIDIIPTDMRMEMIAKAEGHAKNDQALILAGSITAAGGEASDRLKAANNIKDPTLRENVKEQIEVDLAREKRAKSETEYNAYDTLNKEIVAGKSSLEVMKENPALWNKMSGDQQARLKTADARGENVSDIETYNQLNQLAGKDRNKAYDYFVQNAHKLSQTDQKKWSDRLAKPEELEGYLTRSQRLDTALSQIGVDKKTSSDYKLAQDQLDKDTLKFEKEKGRKPDAEELTKLINGITDTVVEGNWLGYGEKKGYEVGQDVRETKGKVTKFDGKIAELESTLTARNGGKSVSISEVERAALYKKWDDKGILND